MLKISEQLCVHKVNGNWMGLEDTVSRYLEAFEEPTSEGLPKNEENVTGDWKKGNSCYVVVDSFFLLIDFIF